MTATLFRNLGTNVLLPVQPLLTKTQLQDISYKHLRIVFALESLTENSGIRDISPTTRRLLRKPTANSTSRAANATSNDDTRRGSGSSEAFALAYSKLTMPSMSVSAELERSASGKVRTLKSRKSAKFPEGCSATSPVASRSALETTMRGRHRTDVAHPTCPDAKGQRGLHHSNFPALRATSAPPACLDTTVAHRTLPGAAAAQIFPAPAAQTDYYQWRRDDYDDPHDGGLSVGEDEALKSLVGKHWTIYPVFLSIHKAYSQLVGLNSSSPGRHLGVPGRGVNCLADGYSAFGRKRAPTNVVQIWALWN
ncbi:hypothetical protein K438DRAFT_2154823 [Mycena galopus ATCC 62051]|nr:hypothetical protein K438DRAFT_2154823 [Mycena galopus ATCC 62051]